MKIHEKHIEGIDNVIKALDSLDIAGSKHGNKPEDVRETIDRFGAKLSYSVRFYTTDGVRYPVDYDKPGQPKSAYMTVAEAYLAAKKFSRMFTTEMQSNYDEFQQDLNIVVPEDDRPKVAGVVRIDGDLDGDAIDVYVNGEAVSRDELRGWNDPELELAIDESYILRSVESMRYLW